MSYNLQLAIIATIVTVLVYILGGMLRNLILNHVDFFFAPFLMRDLQISTFRTVLIEILVEFRNYVTPGVVFCE